MLKEIRTEETRSKQVRLYYLISIGKINQYFSEDGYSAYDTEELEHYQKIARRGRPTKIRPIPCEIANDEQ